MNQEDVYIDGWRCCAGGMLGVRRVARSPNDESHTVERTESGALNVYNARLDLELEVPPGTKLLRVPAGVMAWLMATGEPRTMLLADGREVPLKL